MMARVQAWLATLTARERGMVSLAAGLAMALALAQGVLVPLAQAWQAARAQHQAAAQRSAHLLRQLADLDDGAGAPAKIDPGRLVALAGQGGVSLAPAEAQGSSVRLVGQGLSGAVLAWLESLRGQGLIVQQVTLAPLPEGGVSVDVRVIVAP